MPTDPDITQAELAEVKEPINMLENLCDRDSRREQFFEILRDKTDDGRTVLVITEYTDTLEYLRDVLVNYYGTSLGCYSGEGGKRWDGHKWKSAAKDAITGALQRSG